MEEETNFVIRDEYGNMIVDENGKILVHDRTSGLVYYADTVVIREEENKVYNQDQNTTVSTAYCAMKMTGEESFTKPEGANSELTSVVDKNVKQDRSFTDQSTRLLLDLYLINLHKFRDSSIKKKAVWKIITNEMNKKGYMFSESELERKFRNLKTHFVNIKDQNTKTGRGRLTWPYFSMMEKIFEKDVCVNPAPCISTMNVKKRKFENEESCSTTQIESFGCQGGESSSTLSGFDIISKLHPNTEMLPENASPSVVKEATTTRRLKKKVTESSPYAKNVRKREPPEWVQLMEDSQRKQNEEIKAVIQNHNEIQQERNEILKKVLQKL